MDNHCKKQLQQVLLKAISASKFRHDKYCLSTLSDPRARHWDGLFYCCSVFNSHEDFSGQILLSSMCHN